MGLSKADIEAAKQYTATHGEGELEVAWGYNSRREYTPETVFLWRGGAWYDMLPMPVYETLGQDVKKHPRYRA